MNLESEFFESAIFVVAFFLGLIPAFLFRDSWRNRADGYVRWLQMATYVLAIIGSLASGFVFLENLR